MNVRLLIALLISVSLACAQSSHDPALDRLAKSEIFAFGGVGIAGVPSRGELAYRSILARPSALADFEKLLATGTPEARLYALTGILAIDANRFTQVSKPLRNSQEEVKTERGCIVLHEKFGDILKQIESGIYSSLPPLKGDPAL